MLLTKQQLGAHVMASTDEERFAITHIRIMPSGIVHATNGLIALRVTPKTPPDEKAFPEIVGLNGADPDAPVLLLAETARAAEKIIPKESDLITMDRARLLVNGHVVIGATDLRTPQLVMAEQAAPVVAAGFPDPAAVIPTKAGAITITLNADLLMLVATYAKTFKPAGLHGIKFTFYGPDQPVRFSWSDERHDVDGAVMPIRDIEPEKP